MKGSYRTRPQHRLKQNSTLKHGYCKFGILKHPQMCSYGGYQGIFNVGNDAILLSFNMQ